MSSLSEMSAKPTLQGLRDRHSELQKRLTQMQMQHETIHALHTQQYLSSIRESMRSLFEVISHVRAADKTLVDWHHRSDKLKLALRFVGLDRRTASVVEKKTDKLKARVLVVENKFDSANHLVATGLRATENLKTEFAHFSDNSLDPIAKETIMARKHLDTSHETIEYQIGQQRAEQSTTEGRMRETSQSLARTKLDRQNAEGARGVLAAVS
jgi:hypothetical protein